MNGLNRNRCPLCGGRIIVSDLYQISHEHFVGKTGRVLKKHKVLPPGPLDVSVACCENLCGAYWDADEFQVAGDGKFYDLKYTEDEEK